MIKNATVYIRNEQTGSIGSMTLNLKGYIENEGSINKIIIGRGEIYNSGNIDSIVVEKRSDWDNNDICNIGNSGNIDSITFKHSGGHVSGGGIINSIRFMESGGEVWGSGYIGSITGHGDNYEIYNHGTIDNITLIGSGVKNEVINFAGNINLIKSDFKKGDDSTYFALSNQNEGRIQNIEGTFTGAYTGIENSGIIDNIKSNFNENGISIYNNNSEKHTYTSSVNGETKWFIDYVAASPSKINTIEGTFKNSGGVKNYNGQIDTINADFIDGTFGIINRGSNLQYGESTKYYVSNEEMDCINNYVQTVDINAGINKIEGNFINNSQGAISNSSRYNSQQNPSRYYNGSMPTQPIYAIASIDPADIVEITGNFEGNHKSYDEEIGYVDRYIDSDGGAIYNGGIIGKITNEQGASEGGGISNSTFKDNYVSSEKYSAWGGAIYNGKNFNNDIYIGGNITSIKNSTFEGNEAKSKIEGLGGAIYNAGAIGNLNSDKEIVSGGIIDSSFKNNSASNKGGAIYNSESANVLNIIADTKDVNFKGNKAQEGAAIYNESSNPIVLQALGGNITFENNSTGSIDGTGSGIYSTNGLSLIANNGRTITLNDELDIKGTVSMNGGTIKLGSKAANSPFENVNIEGNTTLDLQNGNADNLVMNNLSSSKNTNMDLKIDWGDTFNSEKSTIEGKITLADVNLSSTNKDDGTVEYIFTNLGDNIFTSDKIALSGVTKATNNFVKYNSEDGTLKSYRTSISEAIEESKNANKSSYVLTENENIGKNIVRGSLTIYGKGHSITGNGLEVKTDDVYNPAELDLEDTNFEDINEEDALTVYSQSKANIIAKEGDITLDNESGNVFRLIKNGEQKAEINIEGNENTVNIIGDIVSDSEENEITLSSGTINHKGLLDPVTMNVNTTYNRISGFDEAVTYNLNAGGILNYTNDMTLYDSAHHTTSTLNTINFNGGTLNAANGTATNFQLADMSINGTSNFYGDVDLANQTMDRFTVANAVTGAGTLNVAGLNLISDAINDKTTINFTNDSVLAAAVDYTGSQGLSALSPIYRYNVDYDKTSGNFDFTRFSTNTHNDYNPAILASGIAAQSGAFLGQLNSYNQAFSNMDMYMLMTKAQRNAMKFQNKYAAANGNLIFDPTMKQYENKAGWFRPYANFENVLLKNGPKISNVAYGTFLGADSELYDIGHGIEGMFSVYASYNGSHQAYQGNSIYQNGGSLGLSTIAYKDNFFAGITANVGASVGDTNTMYGSEDFTMLQTGAAIKTGYNWELADGKFIIQPSYQMSYSMINTFDYTNASGVKIKSDPLHAITFEPGIKLIGNLKQGYQPYAGVSVVWNAMDKTKLQANEVELPQMSVKPYVRYGVGLRKNWGEKLTGFIQTFFTSGGRNGVGFQLGLRWTLGEIEKNQTNSKK